MAHQPDRDPPRRHTLALAVRSTLAALAAAAVLAGAAACDAEREAAGGVEADTLTVLA